MRYTTTLALLIIGSISATTQAATPPASAATFTFTGSAECIVWTDGEEVGKYCNFIPKAPSELYQAFKFGKVDPNLPYIFRFKDYPVSASKLGWSVSAAKTNNCQYKKDVTIKVAGKPKTELAEDAMMVYLDLVSVVTSSGEFKKLPKDEQGEDCK